MPPQSAALSRRCGSGLRCPENELRQLKLKSLLKDDNRYVFSFADKKKGASTASARDWGDLKTYIVCRAKGTCGYGVYDNR